MKYKGRYIGPNKIEKAVKSTIKTYTGEERMSLTYTNDITEDFPLAVIEQVITDTMSDYECLREKRCIPIAEKVLILLTEAELPREDMDYLLNVKILESINMARRNALDTLFGKIDEKLTLYDLDRVIQNGKTNNKSK